MRNSRTATTQSRLNATSDLVSVGARRCGAIARLFQAEEFRAAVRAVGAIRQGVALLSRHPEAGRSVEGMPEGFREWPIGFGDSGYIALYRYDGGDVVLLGVRHSREAGY